MSNTKELEELLRKEYDFAEFLEEMTKVIYEEKITLYRYNDGEGYGNYTLADIYSVWKEKYAPELPAATPQPLSPQGSGMKDSDWNILKHKHPDTQKDVIETYNKLAKDYARLEELEKQVGQIEEGQHPDEIKPRAETWLQERANWQSEVDTLRAKIAEQELIIHGIEEGADEWRMKCDDLQHQLNKLQSPQPDKEPESQREELTMIADVLQIAREDLQYKIAHNVAIDLFKDFQLLNEVRSDVLLIRDRFEGLPYRTFTPDGRLKVSDFIDTKLFMELKTKSTPTSAKTDKEIEELAEYRAECERLAGLVDYWQKKYYELNPPYQKPQLDNL